MRGKEMKQYEKKMAMGEGCFKAVNNARSKDQNLVNLRLGLGLGG